MDASSSVPSSSAARRFKYDVFLSFRGADTRKGITSDLHQRLQGRGIKTFMDDSDLQVGDAISRTLKAAIEESRFAIVVLSRDYASSTWCLEELAKICECMEDESRILPLFFDVEPSHVRYQMSSFGEAFSKHETSGRCEPEKRQRWRDALEKVASFSGWNTQNYKTHNELVDKIVGFLGTKILPDAVESTGDFEAYEATKQAMVKVMKALKDDRPTPIGIYGLGGVGKTTMVKHVAAEAKRQGLFRRVLMAAISHTPDLRKIQGILADQLGVRLEEETDPGRAGRLSREILSRNKILIILDGIWERIDLSDIGIPCYEELQNCSSKVLLTTRNLEVCNSMGSQPKIALKILSEEDSWNLFVKETRMSLEESAVIHDVAWSVARECAGLPIALVATARALRDKNLDVWKEAADQLKSSQPSKDVFNCIKLSYVQLASEDEKLCFLLCCLFPEDYDIQIEELMMYGIGKGLFREYNTLQQARNRCRVAVRSLISSSLLLGTEHDGQVRMHDVIRDVAISISSSEYGQRAWVEAGRQLMKWPKIKDMSYCVISLMMNKIRKLPEKLVCLELKILLLQHNPNVKTIPESFLECLRELSVLDLSKTSISVLPPSFSLLNNLHSLCLDSCKKFSDISILGKLKKLEILSLKECCPEEVPQEIGHLTSLRMLDISESPVVKIASQVMSCLSELEELYMQCDFVDWRNEVEEAGKETNVGFDELTGLSHLHILKVGIPNAIVLPKNVGDPPDWLYFDICISSDSGVRESTWKPHSSHDHSRTLTLSTTINTLPEWFIDVVTEKTEKLQYRKCEDLDNILVEYDRGKLDELRHLSIIGPHENLEEVMNAETRNSNDAVFPKLQELHLFEVEDVKKLCVGNLPPQSLCTLKLLDVRKCHNLVSALLRSNLLERLQCLEKLLCADMHGLEYVFGSEYPTGCKKLQEMRLCSLPKLIKIWSGHAPHAVFSNLKLLAVSGCKKLISLFTADVAQCLSQLEDLWVHSCFKLDRIIEASEETGKMNVIFLKLKNLVLEDLPRLRRLYSNSSGGPTSLAIKFPSLEHFHTRDCPRFSSSASNFHSQKQVQVNDIQQYSFLKKRLWESNEIVSTISEDRQRMWQYDVFLSFRGADTGTDIISYLYNQLQTRGLKTFMDDSDLQVGDVTSRTLLTAIEESRFAIVVLSPNYASSIWCLEELRSICECMEDNNILPLFYHVNPTDVRYQKRRFGDAFTKLETSRQHGDKVDTWRDVLNHVANLSGWHTKDYKTERVLVGAIVDSVYRKVQPSEIEFTMSTGDFVAFEATRKAMEEIMKALTDDEVTAIGVYGMGGVGKTTMVKHVAAQSWKSGIFYRVIKAVVSQIPDLRKIQGTLAEMLGFQFWDDTEIVVRAGTLHKEIMRRENILIILDDIWERIDLPSIGIPSYSELQKCNSKVLLTTRMRNVCRVMKCQANIPLNTLSAEDSWSLFLNTARMGSESINVYFNDVVRKVVRQCAGLPIALITVARALGGKELKAWKRAASALEKSQSANSDDYGEAFGWIKSCYDHLKDEDSKSCFLLCCLFPEDHDIRLENLFKYAIATGLFRRDAETIEEARGTADSVVKYLKDSGLLLDSEEDGCVKMHDVIRDTALNIAKSKDGHGFLAKAGCGLKHWPCGSYQGYSAISVMRNEICKLPEEELVCPNLQILLLKRNADLNEIPEKFIQSLNELRLLDLSNTSISSLPQSFSLLTNLQALYLDFCKKLIDISMVGKLKKLEILSMRECPLRELSREIGHLTNLRILDVNCAGRTLIPSKVISKLHKLEELYILNCRFEDRGSKVEREGEETELGFAGLSNLKSLQACILYILKCGSEDWGKVEGEGEETEFDFAGLSNLKFLQVCMPDAKCIPKNVEVKPDWDYFYILIGNFVRYPYNQRDHKSRSLFLQTTMSTLPDWFINVVTEKTEKLEYDRCKGMSDILMEYDHGRLHNLKHLTVSGYFLDSYVYMTELMNTTRRVQEGLVFENLEELHLNFLIHLEELCVGELPPGSFPNLKVLHMFFCSILKNVSKLVQRLPNLEKLYLNCMDELEYVFGCEGFEPKPSKLREMHLLGPISVKSICSGPVPRVMFQSVKSLTIYRCELLQSLFASDVAKCLVQLEDLLVERCPLLERLIEAVNNEKTTVLPKLKNMVLKKLPMLYGASATVDIECPLLERLIVEDCPQFSFPSSASDYFGSRNPVKLNDPQLYRLLLDRFDRVTPMQL